MTNSITLKNSIISQQLLGGLYYVGEPYQVLRLVGEHKYPTKRNGFYTVGEFPLELRKAIDNIAAKENKIFYIDLVDNDSQMTLFWFEDERDIASEYFL